MTLWTSSMRNRLSSAFWIASTLPWRMVLGSVWVFLLCCQGVQAEEQLGIEVDLWRTSGDIISGELTTVETGLLSMRLGGEVQQIAASEVWQVALAGRSVRHPRPVYWLNLTSGDRWGVQSIKLANEELEFRIPGDDQWRKLDIGSVTGIQPVRPGTTWRTDESEWQQIVGRREKADLVILRNGDQQTGEISTIDDTELTLTGSLGTKSIEWAAVSGLLLNPDLAETPSQPLEGWTILLANDSWLTVTEMPPAHEGLCQLTTVHNVEWLVPWNEIRWSAHWGGGVVPLSRVPITSQAHRPLLGEAFVVARNRNVRGLPFRLNPASAPSDLSKTGLPAICPLGLGLASGMTVQWELDGNYRRFLCGLCLDATACPEGHAVVKISAGNHSSSEVSLRAGDPVFWLNPLDLTGARTLTIETEMGENADVCDWINLIQPVLVR